MFSSRFLIMVLYKVANGFVSRDISRGDLDSDRRTRPASASRHVAKHWPAWHSRTICEDASVLGQTHPCCSTHDFFTKRCVIVS